MGGGGGCGLNFSFELSNIVAPICFLDSLGVNQRFRLVYLNCMYKLRNRAVSSGITLHTC